ncbi:Asp-tRNA(Asn)/Glu-tRNA(Gln) amidotransferase subunit GatA [Candidatus Saccharibacteria bacterium oral taxon 955]|nr:Asp-tRNA(Asn)/Glu-tRNA(Gln) amidotransferase subunit GatA [Candidatus Saccharibacteria bacterium oral taxon 955]QJU05943.1 Asp-tRNA(Asn)/Glu-tRNA(Gln) amidotransferase subunit GatA [Candidatus Saccharibacteria bacterium oral taxon 955]QJU06767.1 Asp-tRNA(Asn)/Glu-tRNA(Gln) amidotransferase subunit GatA [Candidatus Saccharibacteria bacterium oral taxon 955]
MSIASLVSSVYSGATTARKEVEAALARAKAAEEYNAILNLTESRALERADEIDERIKKGEKIGPLAGVPFVVKDNYLAFGAPSTAASKILENFDAPLQATVVERLESAGAICIGKSNLDAFAHGGSTENSAFGVTHNAIDKSKVAGGSSGGSAVVTALDIVPFALGSDTGGSIRQPASFNGVFGMKPTYGMSSRYGVVAMASSTDVMGCFARSANDVALIESVMAGQDPRDMTTLPDYFEAKEKIAPGQRIGLITETMGEGVDKDVRAVVNNYAERLRAAGHTVEEVSMPSVKYALAIYYIVVPAEVSSNLARYDGIRYGRRAEGAKTLAELYGRSRAEGFVTENKRRIMIGSYVLSSGFFDAYYLQAQKARTVLINEFNELFKQYDFLLTPTAPTPAFGIGENVSDPVKMYLSDVMTVPASLAGLPAISIPAGVSGDGLPIGVQLIGKMKADADVIAMAGEVEVANGR